MSRKNSKDKIDHKQKSTHPADPQESLSLLMETLKQRGQVTGKHWGLPCLLGRKWSPSQEALQGINSSWWTDGRNAGTHLDGCPGVTGAGSWACGATGCVPQALPQTPSRGSLMTPQEPPACPWPSPSKSHTQGEVNCGGGRLAMFRSGWWHVFLHAVVRPPEDHGAER